MFPLLRFEEILFGEGQASKGMGHRLVERWKSGGFGGGVGPDGRYVKMKGLARLFLIFPALLIAYLGPLPKEASAEELPIVRVILYKHGVGYFERMGSVEGDSVSVLRFRAKEMNDLLKSLTVLDLGGGSIRTIAYDSTKTVDQQLGEYTFDLKGSQGLPSILEQMKGSEIILTVGEKELRGRLLSVEKRSEKTEKGGAVDHYRIALLLSEGKVKHYDLADVSELRFVHPGLQKEMEKYLDILFSRHRRDEKRVEILSKGRGRRELFVSYVQEQPVWKVSYRIVMEKGDLPLLQGWAIVDNVSTEDWENVELSLVSGLPVSFVQNLYDPLFVRRPEIKVEREVAAAPSVPEAGRLLERDVLAGMAAMKEVSPRPGGLPHRAMAAAPKPGPPRPDLYREMEQQAGLAAGQEAGALFVYRIKEPVSIRRDRSALLPIVNARVQGERVALYNESVRRGNPMGAIRLKNTTDLTLEGGPVTVMDENTYAGEALMGTFKPGEERYVTFAVDLGTRVESHHGGSSEQVYKVSIANGIMTRHVKVRETKVYALENIEEKGKTVIIEHPRRPGGWQLADTPPPREETANVYRFEVKLGPRAERTEKVAFKVVEEMTTRTEYRLTEGIGGEEIAFLLGQRLIDDKTRAFLQQISALRSRISELKRRTEEMEREQKTIFDDQARLRGNLQSLGQSEEERMLRSRIVRQLNQQEDRLETIRRSLRELQTELRGKEEELSRVVLNYTFETR